MRGKGREGREEEGRGGKGGKGGKGGGGRGRSPPTYTHTWQTYRNTAESRVGGRGRHAHTHDSPVLSTGVHNVILFVLLLNMKVRSIKYTNTHTMKTKMIYNQM